MLKLQQLPDSTHCDGPLLILQAKSLGNDIAEKQQVAEVTEAAIDDARTAYKPCGEYTSTLFFCISGEVHVCACVNDARCAVYR